MFANIGKFWQHLERIVVNLGALWAKVGSKLEKLEGTLRKKEYTSNAFQSFSHERS